MAITRKTLDDSFEMFFEIVDKNRKLYLQAEYENNLEIMEGLKNKNIGLIDVYLNSKELKLSEKNYLESLKKEYSGRKELGLDTKLVDIEEFDDFLVEKICRALNFKGKKIILERQILPLNH